MAEIRILETPITKEELVTIQNEWGWEYVKGVADIEKRIIAIGGEWHKEAALLLESRGSDRKNLWGFRLYTDKRGDEAIDYMSNINISPERGNEGRELIEESRRENIRSIASPLVTDLAL